MRERISLVALAGVVALGLFGCGGGGYETSSGFGGMSVNLSGQYLVSSKDPGVMPNLYSIQLTHSGKDIQGIDNLGRTWTGTFSNFTYYGVYATGEEPGQQQTTTTQQQQPQQQLPQSYHAEIYLTMQTGAGPNYITGAVDTNQPIQTGTAQQQVTTRTTIISGTVVDSTGNSGFINLYNSIASEDPTQTP
ncbi:hypothetical protein HQ563_10815 [bacterium]|nr:hypothetical protein [bacterium]